MNNLERIQEEILTLIVLLITLAFTSSNFSPESLKDQTVINNFPLAETNH